MTETATATATSRRLDLPGLAGAVLCCALWGGNAVAVKYAIPDLPPFGCAGFRFLIALPLVALACRAFGQPLWADRRDYPLVLGHALMTVAQIGTFNWGTSHSLAGRASVFINVHPLIVAGLSWLILGERIGIRGLFGLASAAAGVVALFSSEFEGGSTRAGDVVVILSGVIFGCQTIAQKRTFPRIPPATLLFSQYVLAVPLFFASSLTVEGPSAYTFTSQALWSLLYQGVAVSGVCFVTWYTLIRHYMANRVTTIAFLTPLFGVGFGGLFRGEPTPPELIAAGALVGLGIYLVASDRVGHPKEAVLALPGEDAP